MGEHIFNRRAKVNLHRFYSQCKVGETKSSHFRKWVIGHLKRNMKSN